MTYSPHAFEIDVLGTIEESKFVSTDSSGHVIVPDNMKFKFGTGGDASIYFDAAKLVIADETMDVQIGNASNTVTIAGNLTVDGTTTTVNSTTLTVDDKLIELAHSPSGSEGADTDIDGGGIILKSSDSDKSIVWTNSTDSWDFNQAGIFAGILKTDDTTDATSKTDGSLQTDGGLSVAKAIYNGTAATFAADSGIVTIGSTTAATFSAAGLLNINNATDATSTTDGSLQTDGGLSVAKDGIFGNDVKLLTDSSVFAMGVGSDFTITHDNATGAAIAAGASGLAINTDTVTFGSANASDPLVIIQNTTNDASSARLRFVKDKGAAGADGDDIGVIEFYSDDSAQTQTVFAKIVAEVSESLDTDEAGKLSFYVAESDGTTTALAAGLVLEGEHATNGEVDVTIGAGTASTTTVAGNLTVTGDVTISGDDLTMGTNTDTYILVADGTNYNPVAMSGDVAITNAGVASIQANSVDGTHIALGSDAQGDVMYYDGTNWARLGYGTSGHFLKTQGSSANPTWAAATVSSLACDDLAEGDAAVLISTTTGNITIDATANDSDIIFKGTDNTSDITMLTLDGSEAGAATFNSSVIATTSVKATTVFVVGVENATATGAISKGFTDVDASAGNKTMTLPTGASGSIGNMYTIKKMDSSTNTVTVTTATNDKIDGGDSLILYHQYESITVVYAATNKYYVMQ